MGCRRYGQVCFFNISLSSALFLVLRRGGGSLVITVISRLISNHTRVRTHLSRINIVTEALRCVVAGVIMKRWFTFCGVAPCTGMSESSFGLSSRLQIVLFVFVICWLFVSGVILKCVFYFCLR
jgi:hypothetical protein